MGPLALLKSAQGRRWGWLPGARTDAGSSNHEFSVVETHAVQFDEEIGCPELAGRRDLDTCLVF